MDYPGETDINSVEFHPQLSRNRHSVDGVLVDAGSFCWWVLVHSGRECHLMATFKT
jgi:hypothetical protein